jgi:hypothetical protein
VRDILECAHFIILVRSTCAHYSIEGAYKNYIKQITSLSTFPFTFTIGFVIGILQSVQSDTESVHPNADVEPQQRPKWAQTTLEDVGDLVGDPTETRRTRSDFEDPPIALTATEPFLSTHIFLVQIHSLMERLLEIPFGNLPCRGSTIPSSRTRDCWKIGCCH